MHAGRSGWTTRSFQGLLTFGCSSLPGPKGFVGVIRKHNRADHERTDCDRPQRDEIALLSVLHSGSVDGTMSSRKYHQK